MSDWKSKLPSLAEVGSITKKLVGDIKNSVTEIINDYKEKHPHVPDEVPPKPDVTEPVNKEPPPEIKESVNKEGVSPKEMMPETPSKVEPPAVVKPSEDKPIKTEPTPKDDSNKE